MRALVRLAIVTTLLLAAAPRSASAIPVLVAEFRWDATLLDPGVECSPDDPACEAVAATYLSTYSLTGLWDGPDAAPVLTGNVGLGGAAGFDWLPISFDTGYFDQLALVEALPTFALTNILFEFGGQTRTLSALLDAPGFATLSFDTDDTPTAGVPEPGTVSLIGLGLGCLALAIRRRPRTRAPLVS